MGWFNALFRRRRTERQMDEEIRAHIAMQAEEYRRNGMSERDAEEAARRRFGNIASIAERCREQNRSFQVESVWQDLRFAARTLKARPGFSVTVLLTLALGIGANAAIFSALRGILLDPLPFPNPERIVAVWESDKPRASEREGASCPDYYDLRQQSRQFEHLAAIQFTDATLTGNGEPERIRALRVTANYFRVLGLAPLAGRTFGEGEAGVVISESLWRRRYGSSAAVVGQGIVLDGFNGTILGVMPREANLLEIQPREAWISLENPRCNQRRGQHNTHILGRLNQGANLKQTNAELATIMAGLEKAYPGDNTGRSAYAVPVHEDFAGNMRPALSVLMAGVVGVLLIACVNIANLLLARAATRRHEMAIRVSLGAQRGRLTRQLLTESALLAFLGGLAGVAVAYYGVKGLVATAPAGTPLLGRVSLDPVTVAGALALTIATWLLFGLAPAFRTSNVAPQEALLGAVRGQTSRGALRLLHGLVVAEIGLSLVLVFCAVLVVRSFWNLRTIDVGYEPQGVVSLRVHLPESRYPYPNFPFREWPAATAFFDRLKIAAKQIPGVESVSIAMSSPAVESWTTRVFVVGKPVPAEGDQKEAELRVGDPDYLATTRIRLQRGRFFTPADDSRHPMVAVVNESFVREWFPGEDPIGRSISVWGIPREIVGVINDVRYAGPSQPARAAMYYSVAQLPFPEITLLVRSAVTDPARLVPELRRAVAAADPAVAPFNAGALEEALAEATARERFVMILLTAFGGLALILAVVGIYGVVAYAVEQRRRDIALRMAMGATAREIFAEVTAGVLRRTGMGMVVGVAGAIATVPLLQPVLFQTNPRDPLIWCGVAAVLVATALAGAAIPAARAALTDPVTTLRGE